MVTTNVVEIAPPRKALKQIAISPDDALCMGQEADLAEVIVIGRTKDGELYCRAGKLGVYAQSRRDLARLAQDFLDDLMASAFNARRS